MNVADFSARAYDRSSLSEANTGGTHRAYNRVREQGLEGFEVVALDEEVAGFGITGGEVAVAIEEAQWNLSVVIDDRFFPDPAKFQHGMRG